MFMGTYYNSIDSKNRVIVPLKHRDILGGRCVLTKGFDKCLYIYTMEDWERQTIKLSELPESDPEIRAFIRSFYGSAVECEFDKQGRIVIPATLKEYAQIKKELVTVGSMKKVEIWSKELWEAPGEDIHYETDELAGKLAKYNY